jgi:uncharacterized membrane protein (UPF0127 family)
MLPADATHNQASIDIAGVRLKVQIADTPDLRERGLSGRSSLAPFDGMLFVFDEPSTLWMKGMLFPLDIIWVSSKGHVADITEGAQPDSYPKRFSPATPTRYAIEVPAGFVRQHEIEAGDRVSL